jgi:hypothetical protein
MPSDAEIYRAAAELIENSGPLAMQEAAIRADTMRAVGDGKAHNIWLAIVRAITTLQAAKWQGETLH